MKNISTKKCDMTDQSDSSEGTGISSPKLSKCENIENNLSESQYKMDQKEKEGSYIDKAIPNKFTSTGHHSSERQLSPTATSSAALPG